MSYRDTLEDINDVTVGELNGVTAATEDGMTVTANTDGSFSLAASGGGGGGGGGAPTAYTSTVITDGNLQITLTAGLWRFFARSSSYSGSAAISTTSGFSNIEGGWYRWQSRGDVDNSATREGWGVYNSGESRFDVLLHGADGSNNTTLVWSSDRTTGTSSSNPQWMCGSNANNPFSATGGRIEGELIVSDDVVLTILAGAFPASGVQSATSGNIYFAANKIT